MSEAPNTPKAASNLIEWSCSHERIEANQLPDLPEITVGEVFWLRCEGPPTEIENRKTVAIKNPAEKPYDLKLVRVKELTGARADLLVTSYVPGELKFEQTELTDGHVSVALKVPSLNVTSVIPKEEQNPAGFGPYLPHAFAWPLFLWIALAVLVGGVGYWAFYKLRKRAQKKRVRKELLLHQTALSPFNQFNKDIRVLQKQNLSTAESEKSIAAFVAELDQLFRQFILRHFMVPALDWTSGQTYREISRRKRLKGKPLKQLLITLRELDRARVRLNQVKEEDALQLLDMCRKLALEIQHQAGVRT